MQEWEDGNGKGPITLNLPEMLCQMFCNHLNLVGVELYVKIINVAKFIIWSSENHISLPFHITFLFYFNSHLFPSPFIFCSFSNFKKAFFVTCLFLFDEYLFSWSMGGKIMVQTFFLSWGWIYES